MHKFNLFRKKPKTNKNIVGENGCSHLTDINDCDVIVTIRQLQIELDQSEEKINKLMKCDPNEDFVELRKFFFNSELHYLHYKISNHRYGWFFDLEDIEAIYKALLSLSSTDRLLFEIKTILDRGQLIKEEQNRAKILRNKISEAKNILGIE